MFYIAKRHIYNTDSGIPHFTFFKLLFQDLLPRGCYHPIYYSVTYEDSWKCNFLGIFSDVHIPDHVTSSELHIQINITSKNEDDAKSLEDFEIVFHTTATLPEKCKYN